MTTFQSGKALLTVEKDGDDPGPGSLFVSINCLSGIDKDDDGGQDWLYRSASELAAYCDWLPTQCLRMENGDKCVFKVTFEQSYFRGDGYSSDDDEELIFSNVRKLQHKRGKNDSRKFLKKFYQPKNKAKFGGKIKYEYDTRKHATDHGFY